MTLRTSAYALVALVVATAVVAACKVDSAVCNGTPANLVGTYNLLSYTTGSTTIPAPPASGVLRFHATTYGVSLVLPVVGAIADSGTYSQCGATGISQNSVLGQPQFTGSYQIIGDTLAVTGTAAGTAAQNVWVKAS